ncbi:uncharacterized protein LY89DRAFT_773691, partial [Mollisia scopiformis]
PEAKLFNILLHVYTALFTRLANPCSINRQRTGLFTTQPLFKTQPTLSTKQFAKMPLQILITPPDPIQETRDQPFHTHDVGGKMLPENITTLPDHIKEPRGQLPNTQDIAEEMLPENITTQPDLAKKPRKQFPYTYDVGERPCVEKERTLRKLRERFGKGNFEFKIRLGKYIIQVPKELLPEVIDDMFRNDPLPVSYPKVSKPRPNLPAMAPLLHQDLGPLVLINEHETERKMHERFGVDENGKENYKIQIRRDHWIIWVPEIFKLKEAEEIFADVATEMKKSIEIEEMEKQKRMKEYWGEKREKVVIWFYVPVDFGPDLSPFKVLFWVRTLRIFEDFVAYRIEASFKL